MHQEQKRPAHFEENAAAEKASADRLRLVASSLVLLVSAIAGVVLVSSNFTATTLAGDIARIAVTLPIAVLAGYLGREASRHRASANWYRLLEVQLKTLDAFVAPLEAGEQARQRAELAEESSDCAKDFPRVMRTPRQLSATLPHSLKGWQALCVQETRSPTPDLVRWLPYRDQEARTLRAPSQPLAQDARFFTFAEPATN